MSLVETRKERGYEFLVDNLDLTVDAGLILAVNVLADRTDDYYSPRAAKFDIVGNQGRQITVSHPSPYRHDFQVAPGVIRLLDHAEPGKDVMFMTFGSQVKFTPYPSRTRLVFTSDAPIIYLGNTLYVQKLESDIYGRFGAWLAQQRAFYLDEYAEGKPITTALMEVSNRQFIEMIHKTTPMQLYKQFLIDTYNKEQEMIKHRKTRANGFSHWAGYELRRLGIEEKPTV